MKRSQPNGLLGNPNNPTEAGRYMYGHGFGTAVPRQRLRRGGRRASAARSWRRLLTKAVEFTGKAQTDTGRLGLRLRGRRRQLRRGLGDDHQVQALRAARNAGIVVPKAIIDKATST